MNTGMLVGLYVRGHAHYNICGKEEIKNEYNKYGKNNKRSTPRLCDNI